MVGAQPNRVFSPCDLRPVAPPSEICSNSVCEVDFVEFSENIVKIVVHALAHGVESLVDTMGLGQHKQQIYRMRSGI